MSVLANEPLGSFMVRNSESQPGTLALSVRVPKAFHPLGITHYIIVRLEAGYQIKVEFREIEQLTWLDGTEQYYLEISLFWSHSVWQ